MPIVDLVLGNRSFRLQCDEGQESHLQNLAGGVDKRMNELSGLSAGANDTLLLVMTSLMMQDEINENNRLKNSGDAPVASNVNIEQEIDDAVSEAIDAIADYVEDVADRVQNG